MNKFPLPAHHITVVDTLWKEIEYTPVKIEIFVPALNVDNDNL